MKTNREEKLEEKLNKLQSEIKIIRQELHRTKQKNRDIEKSRKQYKEETKSQEDEIHRLTDELKKNADSIVSTKAIEGHKYKEVIVELCVSLVCVCGLSLGSRVKVLRFLNGQFHLGMEEIPCHNSIKNWIEKSGYYTYTHSQLKSLGVPYGGILDESMQTGSEKLRKLEGIPATMKKSPAYVISDNASVMNKGI
ncbi:MAG: hypothetical protein LBL79_08980 [Prevotella sp.]|jgi:uncharacterized protein YaaR (DUF327 family)|nr:hypothetical protein [Prevotella sp.]